MLWDCARQPAIWNLPKKHGPHGELFFSLIEQVVFSERDTEHGGSFSEGGRAPPFEGVFEVDFVLSM